MTKSIEEILTQEPVFLNEFKLEGEVFAEFTHGYFDMVDVAEKEKLIADFKEVRVLFASYGAENYSGSAFVLFEQGGKLYETHGNHCSCYGLEGQWNPEEVDLKELEHRLIKGSFGEDEWSGNNFKKELCEFLGVEYVKYFK